MTDSASTTNEQDGAAMDRANTLTQVTNQHIIAGFRGLILTNAGGAAALGAFVQGVWGKPGATGMLAPVLHGVIWLLVGTAFAASGFVARYLQFFSRNSTQPHKNIWWWAELVIIVIAVCCFLVGMLTATLGALSVVPASG